MIPPRFAFFFSMYRFFSTHVIVVCKPNQHQYQGILSLSLLYIGKKEAINIHIYTIVAIYL